MGDPANWSCSDVSEWLKEHGFQRYCKLLCVDHQIDGQSLLNLTENDLRQPPIEIRVIGDVKRLIQQIKTLRTKVSVSLSRKNGTVLPNGVIPSITRETILDLADSTDFSDVNCNDVAHKPKHTPKQFDPEKKKVILSIIYFFIGMYTTCYCIAVVQEQAPDQVKHPPLPDVFLNHFPQVSWAYRVSDAVLISLSLTWLGIVIIHKHKWILVRRTFCLMGSMYLLRCVCILITQLPVPETNVKCDRRVYTDVFSRLKRALEIFLGGGLKVTGLKTCGDYMFSGHTVTMTLLNFFINQYTPRKLWCLQLVSWVANLFGMFFILAGHGHYSIDVFVAFLLSSRLFLYYHTLANNINLMTRDSKRTKLWFPIFYYFESNSPGLIPHDFEWPFPSWTSIKSYLRGYELVSSKDKS